MDKQETPATGWAEIDQAETLIARAVGDDQYGVRVWLGDPSWKGGPPSWRMTDPHRGMDAYAFAWYRGIPPPVEIYTREQYEAACAAVGLTPAPDEGLGSYADMYSQFAPSEYPAIVCVEVSLRRRRMAGIDREITRRIVTNAIAAPPDQPGGPVADRQAAVVAEMIGLPAPTPTGACHYCGLPLNRQGDCDECR